MIPLPAESDVRNNNACGASSENNTGNDYINHPSSAPADGAAGGGLYPTGIYQSLNEKEGLCLDRGLGT